MTDQHRNEQARNDKGARSKEKYTRNEASENGQPKQID